MAFRLGKHQEQTHEGIFTRIAHDIVAAYDWMSGPAMSDRDRLQRDLLESRHEKQTIGQSTTC